MTVVPTRKRLKLSAPSGMTIANVRAKRGSCDDVTSSLPVTFHRGHFRRHADGRRKRGIQLAARVSERRFRAAVGRSIQHGPSDPPGPAWAPGWRGGRASMPWACSTASFAWCGAGCSASRICWWSVIAPKATRQPCCSAYTPGMYGLQAELRLEI